MHVPYRCASRAQGWAVVARTGPGYSSARHCTSPQPLCFYAPCSADLPQAHDVVLCCVVCWGSAAHNVADIAGGQRQQLHGGDGFGCEQPKAAHGCHARPCCHLRWQSCAMFVMKAGRDRQDTPSTSKTLSGGWQCRGSWRCNSWLTRRQTRTWCSAVTIAYCMRFNQVIGRCQHVQMFRDTGRRTDRQTDGQTHLASACP